MPDVLLIQPPIRDYYRTAKRTLPYGLGLIADALVRDGVSVEILDALATRKVRSLETPPAFAHLAPFYGRPDRSPFALFHGYRHYGHAFSHIEALVRRSGAFLVGISSLFTPYWDEALETARIVRQALPKAWIVAGGHHPTALPETVLSSDAVDFVIRGEGEAALPALYRALRSGASPESVPGIGFRKPDGTFFVREPAVVDAPRGLAPAALERIRTDAYRRRGRGGTVVVASRGCPMACTYCAVGGGGLPYRRRPVADVLAEIETAVARSDARFIDFEDENLSLDRAWFHALLAGIRERFGPRTLELRAMNGLYAPTLDADLVDAMAEAGFSALNLSLCTTHPDALRRFRRPDLRKAVARAVELGRARGMDAVTYILVGAPGQRAGDAVDDLLFLAELPTLAGVSVFYPAPGSVEYRRTEAAGRLPGTFAAMRSAALPVSDATTRLESATLLRLGRILNFMKRLRGRGVPLWDAPPARPGDRIDGTDREAAGRRLLAAVGLDGVIPGVAPDGRVYGHAVAGSLVAAFRQGIARRGIAAPGAPSPPTVSGK
jgi:tRNA A37 methylthiotransferase MiaB